jgi:hypothetical protein
MCLTAEAAGEDALRTAAGTAALQSGARVKDLGLWKTLSIGGGYADGVKAKETKGE